MSWPWAAGRLAQDDRDQYRDGAKNLPGIEALIKDHPAKQGRNDGVEEAKNVTELALSRRRPQNHSA